MKQFFYNFITFEGIDGSGKTTLAKMLTAYLAAVGYPTLLTSEPGGTFKADLIKDILKMQDGEELSEYSKLLLFMASRNQHLINFIMPAIRAGKIVICDRFIDSTHAYQGIDASMAMKIDLLEKWMPCHILPKITILLDLEPEAALARKDYEGSSDLSRVRAKYLHLAKIHHDRIHLVDANRPLEIIFKDILKLLNLIH